MKITKLFLAGALLLASMTTFANGDHDTYAAPQHHTNGVIYLRLGKGKLFYYRGNPRTIFVGNPNIADFVIKTPGILYFTAKRPGETNLIAVGTHNQVLFRRTIIVRIDVARLRNIIRKAAPHSDVTVETMKDGVILRGTVRNPTVAADITKLTQAYLGSSTRVMNFMKVRSPVQVYLRVRVVEMSRNIGRVLGLNWRLAVGGNDVRFATQFNGSNSSNGNLGNVFNLGNLTSGNGLVGAASNLVGLGIGGSNLNFNAIIDAMEQRGLATVLAEPNLTTMSGTSANFNAGGEFPIPVGQGFGAVSVTFRRFGVSLNFTPTIVNDDVINLKLHTDVSSLSSQGAVSLNGFSIPGLSSRTANTTVELRSGQSFAVAGLLQKNMSEVVKKFPGLGDIPILGKLFRSKSFENNQTELVIVVTPFLVKPVDRKKITVPTDTLPNLYPPKGREPVGKKYGLILE